MVASSAADVATYVCGAITSLILLLRLASTFGQANYLDASFIISAMTFVVVIARIIVTYYLIQYGTVGDYFTLRAANPFLYFSDADLNNFQEGSKLSIVARILLTSCLWLMITLLLLLYRRFVEHLPWMKNALRATWALIAATYIAVVLTTFLECHPFNTYWQLSSNPGTCIKAYAQLITQCVSNIILDLVLMGIAIPMLFIAGKQKAYQIRIAALISLGVVAILVSCLRVVYTFKAGSLQSTRTLWASVSVLAAAFVANAPVLYGAFRRIRATRGESKASSELNTVASRRDTLAPVPWHSKASPDGQLTSRTSGEFDASEKRKGVYVYGGNGSIAWELDPEKAHVGPSSSDVSM